MVIKSIEMCKICRYWGIDMVMRMMKLMKRVVDLVDNICL